MSAVDAPYLIETMRVENGDIALLTGHLHRLEHASNRLRYPYDKAATRAAIEQQAAALRRGTWRLRLTLSASGQLELEHSLLPDTTAPVTVALAPTVLPHSSWLQIKSSYRPWYADVTQQLTAHPDVFDFLFFNDAEELCEGSRSNVYLKINEEWYTPPLQCGLLGGVMRAHLLATGHVHERTLYRADLEGAQAIRVSNALRGWLDARLVTL